MASSVKSKAPLMFSCRMVLAIMSFLGLANLHAQRVNMSVAMVCMINHTALHMEREQLLYHKHDKYHQKSLGNVTEAESGKESTGILKDNVEQLQTEDGTIVWNKYTQGIILGSFFWGYLFTQIPGGWLSLRFGGKNVFGLSMLICSVATLFTPLAANFHYAALIALRFVAGMSQGVVYPSVHALWSYWAPPLERSRLIGFTLAGAHVGLVVTFPLAGIICEIDFAGGWPFIFYVPGIAGILCFIVWMICIYDSPVQHPRIGEIESQYIQASLEGQINAKEKKQASIPWKAMMTSAPVWAVFISLTCGAWLEYSFLTNIPTYLREVLYFDIKKIGLVSCIPYIGTWIVTISSGFITDALRQKKVLGTTCARKINVAAGMLIPSVLCVALGYVDSTHWLLAVIFLTTAISVFGCLFGGGYFVSFADIAPKYSSILFAIGNTIASIPGFVAPYLIGVITKNQTQDEWRIVFFTTSAIVFIGCVTFLVFGSGELQPWASKDSIGAYIIEDVIVEGEIQLNDTKNRMTGSDENFTD